MDAGRRSFYCPIGNKNEKGNCILGDGANYNLYVFRLLERAKTSG